MTFGGPDLYEIDEKTLLGIRNETKLFMWEVCEKYVLHYSTYLGNKPNTTGVLSVSMKICLYFGDDIFAEKALIFYVFIKTQPSI